VFGTAHKTAPLWTVQFHPEITVSHREDLVDNFGWRSNRFSFEDVTPGWIFEDFMELAMETTE
jgi:GMP synthase (glutamine-hydrolysing)